MKLICLYCGKSFEGLHDKFCSVDCEKAYFARLERRLKEAVEKDPSHTKKMSV